MNWATSRPDPTRRKRHARSEVEAVRNAANDELKQQQEAARVELETVRQAANSELKEYQETARSELEAVRKAAQVQINNLWNVRDVYSQVLSYLNKLVFFAENRLFRRS